MHPRGERAELPGDAFEQTQTRVPASCISINLPCKRSSPGQQQREQAACKGTDTRKSSLEHECNVAAH
jgi:hypothetical protein